MSHSGKFYGPIIITVINPITNFIQWMSSLLKSYRQVNFILLRMANPTIIEAPSRRGILIDQVRLREVG